MNHTQWLSALFLVAVSTTGFADTNCEQGNQFYQLGMKAGSDKDFDGARSWLKKSVDSCPTYDAWHLLGRAEQKLGNYSAALDAFKAASKLAADSDQQASSVGRYGETLALAGQRDEALSMLQQARELHSKPAPEWMTALAMEIDKSLADRPMSKTQITRGLGTQRFGLLDITDKKSAPSTTTLGSTQGASLGTQPKVNIRINFAFNSTSVDEFSRQNVQSLADALTDPSYGDKKFVLVGHSDIRGGEIYNQNLSQERADAIKSMLVNLKPELNGRIVTKGAGSAQPLYDGNTEEIFRLNRRLEVRVE